MKKIILTLFIISSVICGQSIYDIDEQLDNLIKDTKGNSYNCFIKTGGTKFEYKFVDSTYKGENDNARVRDKAKFIIGNSEFEFVQDKTYTIFVVTEDKTPVVSSPEELIAILRINEGGSTKLKLSQIVKLSKQNNDDYKRFKEIVFEMLKNQTLTNQIDF